MVPEAEVKVKKVKKIEPVYNLITRPMVYSNNPKMVTMRQRPAAYVAAPGTGKVERVLSAEDIDYYIKKKKEQFQHGETHKQQYV
jgi:hypothetical protein